jgi:ribosomal protein L29
MDDETRQLQLRVQELQKQVADLKAENARLKTGLSEQDLKNIKWCGTPMIDGEEL